MCGMGCHAWILCLLTVAQTARPSLSASHGFVYGRLSCGDLLPRHPEAVAEGGGKGVNHVRQPGEEGGRNSTAEEGASTTEGPPPPEPGEYEGDMEVEVLASEEGYRRLKTLKVTLQSSDYINGFMLQARSGGEEEGGGPPQVVGRFLSVPHRAEYLTCPNGEQEENTAVHEAAPLRLANLTFTWMAPREDHGSIQFVASVLLNAGTQYKVYKSAPLKLNLYPVSTKGCAVAKSCFRYCMRKGGMECEAHSARYMATLEYLSRKTRVKITLGGQMPHTNGYLAIAFGRDRHRLSEMDISICFRSDEDGVGVEHYLLKDVDYPPDLHLGVLTLDTSDVDEDHVWCTFTRPLTGRDDNLIDLREPHFYFYFWGMRNGSTIYLPSSRDMKRSARMISLEDKLFNEILNSGGSSLPRTPYGVIAAVLLFFVVHFLCW